MLTLLQPYRYTFKMQRGSKLGATGLNDKTSNKDLYLYLYLYLYIIYLYKYVNILVYLY